MMTSILKIVTMWLFVAIPINSAMDVKLQSFLYTGSDDKPQGILHPSKATKNSNQHVSIYFNDQDNGEWTLEKQDIKIDNTTEEHTTIRTKNSTYLYAADDYHKYDEERRSVFLFNTTKNDFESKKQYLWDFFELTDEINEKKLKIKNLSGKTVRIRNVLYSDEYLLAGYEGQTIFGNPRVFTGKKYVGQKGTNMKWKVVKK